MKIPPGQRHTDDGRAVSSRMFRTWILTKAGSSIGEKVNAADEVCG